MKELGCNYIELAKSVVNQFIQECKAKENCISTSNVLYCSINNNGNIVTSQESSILNNASECIIILACKELALINYYYSYKIVYVDSEGIIHNGFQKGKWKICIYSIWRKSNIRIGLYFGENRICTIGQGKTADPWSEPLRIIWDIYMALKEKEKIEMMKPILQDLISQYKSEMVISNKLEKKKGPDDILEEYPGLAYEKAFN